MKENVIIRNERKEDWEIVETITRQAFYNLYVPGCVEHYLVHNMREHEDFISELDFVLELNGNVIGNIMYTKAKLIDENKNKKDILADYKTNLNYKSSGWFFLCNLYKNGKTRKRCKRMNDSAFLNSRRTGIFKDMSNGTICIPKDLRDNNGLEKNDRVELIPMQEGIYIRKAYGEKKCQ